MALKARVAEKCERCGQRNARKIGNRIVLLAHACLKAPSGPPSAPHSFRVDEVVFEPGDFDPAFLRQELDVAWATIDDLRDKRWKAERRATEAIGEAMASVYNPSTVLPTVGDKNG